MGSTTWCRSIARLERDTDVEYEALPLDRVLRSTSGDGVAGGDPGRVPQQSDGAVDAGAGRGDAGAYAAAGTTAADGTGRNSPYTSALLSYLEQPLELSALFRRVRAQVLEMTEGAQRPHEYGSLLAEHYLGGTSGPGTVTVADNVSATVQAQQESLFWQSIMNSPNPAEFEAYPRQYPAGAFRALAAVRLAALRPSATDPPAADRRAPGTVFRDCPTCPELVVVPAGRFRMGCVSGRDCADDEQPVHEVELASFALGVYFDRFVQATGHRRPEDRGWGRGGRPV